MDWTHKVVIPVKTPGYASHSASTEYSYDSISAYMEAGLIYVQPGLRGKDSLGDGYQGNAPWDVVDLKATVRYLRSNGADQVFVFGNSGGGAQSAARAPLLAERSF